jgi:ribosomal protein L11 methyltransferase
MQFLDDMLDASPQSPTAFIDVGCGSGILSIAALKLGVRSALGVDIDPQAIDNARQNAHANGLGSELQLGVGSVGEILNGDYALRRAPLVAANILAPVILGLLQDGLLQILDPGGRLVLAGILQSQEQDMLEGCRKAGLHMVARRQMGDWIGLCMSGG